MKTSFRIATLTAGLVISFTSIASAQSGECTVDADCPAGYTCDIVDYEACPPCVEGEECPPCETGSSSTCTPPPPQECDADTPCSGDDVCVTYTFESCTGGGSVAPCDPDDEACEMGRPQPDEPECTSETESYCVPPYLAPCQADADCGDGFTCEEVEICQCSSDGAPMDGSGDEPVEPECSCEPLDEKYCKLIEVECDVDGDCSGDLTCQEIFADEAPTIACAPGEECPEPEPVDPTSYCAPVGYDYYGTDVAAGNYDEVVEEASGREGEVTSSERSEFFPVDGSPSDGDSKRDPSGCTTAAGGGAGGSLLLLALGFLGLRRRRQ